MPMDPPPAKNTVAAERPVVMSQSRGSSPGVSNLKPYLHPNHKQRSTPSTPSPSLHNIIPQVEITRETERVSKSKPRTMSKEPMPHPEIYDLEAARGRLNRRQINRLCGLLDEEYNVVSKDGTIRVTVSPFKLIARLIAKLSENSVYCLNTGIRLVGSGAAHTLMDEESNGESGQNSRSGHHEHAINDIDFCFYVPDTVQFQRILEIEEMVLCDIIDESKQLKYSVREIYDLFFLDSVKVEAETSKESWSLITIGESGLRTIDIKFVIKSRRSWVFSADSFEIVLDSLFQQLIEVARPNGKSSKSTRKSDAKTSTSDSKSLADALSSLNTSADSAQDDNSIIVESLYADFAEALDHLKTRRLYTKRPEEIRRGIFRYCHELAKGKTPANDDERVKLDRVFVESFLNEKTSNFDEVLRKFLTKHTSSSLHCLDQLYDIFTRSGSDAVPEMLPYLNIISTYRDRYERLTHMFPENNSGKEGSSSAV